VTGKRLQGEQISGSAGRKVNHQLDGFRQATARRAHGWINRGAGAEQEVEKH